MRLNDLQQALRDVLRQPDVPPNTNDPELAEYLASVVNSGRVSILTHVISSWRVYDLARACPLTVAALRARGGWQDALTTFQREPAAPFVERLAARFLDTLADHGDPLVASVARFERAYLAVTHGSDECFTVWWDREPTALLAALLSGAPIDESEGTGTYLTRVAQALPAYFEVVPRPSQTPAKSQLR